MLRYKKSGSGPTIVLIHGFLLSYDYWHDTQRDLEQHFTVISIDLLGFGRSPKPKHSNYTLSDQVAALHHTLTELGVDSCILVGHSMGGVIAARYAVLYPQQVTRLLLYMPPIFSSPTQAYQSIYQTNTLYRIGLYSPYGRLLWIPIRGIMQVAPFVLNSPKKHVARALRRSTHQSRILSQKHIIEGEPLIPILRKLRTPTDLFIGRQDRLIYQDNIAKDKQQLHHISIHYLDHGHHFIVKNPTHIRHTIM